MSQTARSGSVVLLSGPVGAGKTTVARALVAASPAPVAYIEGDTFWSFIAKGPPEQKRLEAFRMIMRAMTASARHFERDGYEVILDFSIPPWYLDGIRALLQGKPFEYVVLRPSLEVCIARAAARSEGTIRDYSIYSEFYADFAGMEANTIRDDESDAQTIAARIRSGLAAGTFRMQ